MPAPTLSTQPTILAAWFCPFAQRTLIAANFKKPSLQYTHHEVSFDELYGKPQWFNDLHPQGLIPVIAFKKQQQQQGQQQTQPLLAPTAAAQEGVVSIKESLVCNEYLEDAYPEPPLMPADPVAKAAARNIIHRFNDKAVPAFYKMLVQQQEASQAAAAAAFDAELQWLVQQMHPEGPFALGKELSLVDCAVAPFLLRLPVLEMYRQYNTHKSGDIGARLSTYCTAAERHPAVKATLYHPDGLDYYPQLLQSYARYADGSANSMMARDAAKKD